MLNHRVRWLALAALSTFGCSQPDYYACTSHEDCVIQLVGCACGGSLPAAGVHRDRAAELFHDLCGAGRSCSDSGCLCVCPDVRDYIAVCEHGQCGALHLTDLELTNCATDADCVARGTHCCDAPPSWPLIGCAPGIAVAADEEERLNTLFCDPSAPCRGPGASGVARCVGGHCSL